jgi:S1-C subfamily serine protease
MASGLVIHIVSGDDRHTEVLMQERIRIGFGADCDLRLRGSARPVGAENADVVLELGRGANHYRIKGYDSAMGLTLNGEPVELNARIKDGDELLLNGSGLGLQFFPVRALPAVVNQNESMTTPFSTSEALELGDRPRRDDAKVFIRELTRELIREINPSTKIITLLIMGILVGGILYIGFSIFREMRTLRRTSDNQRSEAVGIKDALDKAIKDLAAERARNEEIRRQLALTYKVSDEFSKGVCVVSGSYIFTDASTGRPLRYPSSQQGEEGNVIQDGDDPGQLTPEGDGAIAEFEFIGTGFYVGSGYIVTNKHVVQPWQADVRAQSLSASVNGKPKLKSLVAYFPGIDKPLPIKVKQTSSREDLATCVFEGDEPPNLPVLTIDESPDVVAVGKEVVVIGYPNGTNRLLANFSEADAQNINARYGRSLESLLGYLASVNKVTPQTTKGTITDLNPERIVHGAFTAEGGSGAPLFGENAHVIGVNFAIFPENTAANMAIPARFVLSLLNRAGWKPPAPNADGNAAATPAGSK